MTGDHSSGVRRLVPVPVCRDQETRPDRALRSVPAPAGPPSTAGSGTVGVAAWVVFCDGVPDAGERLVREHRPDEHGRCRGCPHSNTLAPAFPCVLRLIGEATVRLHQQEAGPGAGPRDAA